MMRYGREKQAGNISLWALLMMGLLLVAGIGSYSVLKVEQERLIFYLRDVHLQLAAESGILAGGAVLPAYLEQAGVEERTKPEKIWEGTVGENQIACMTYAKRDGDTWILMAISSWQGRKGRAFGFFVQEEGRWILRRWDY